MESLLYFVLWAAAIFLMMRFGCGAHIMGHSHGGGKTDKDPERGHSPGLRWVPPEKDVDPVCKKTVATDKAKPSVHAGNVYYFCSRDCREAFEAGPEIYVEGDGLNSRKLEHIHA